jgi:isoleucyl-tRNA synthetase
MNYKDTLNMPVTNFPMRGNLGVKEVEIQDKWTSIKLYDLNVLKNKDNMPFVLHDGPPYANGDIHIGHALNKILKDFVLRYKTMSNHYVRYIPGWDTHGLPIETALAKKGIKRKDMPLFEYRKLCYDYAMEQVDRQKVQFKRLGILGEWDHPYITLQPEYEAAQIQVFNQMAQKGLIYKGLKPVYWSPSSETALAEAEIEYKDVEDTSIYVAFKLISDDPLLKDASIIIWTTTPWTLPANMATTVHPNLEYVLVETSNKKFVLGASRLNAVSELAKWGDVTIIKQFKGHELEHLIYEHPLFDKTCPIILGDHVTDEDGSGLVHTAPGHGEEDYIVGKKYQLDVFCPVDGRGFMTQDALQYEGLFYSEANEQIIKDLETKGILVQKNKFMHSYPHDWRTQKPVIFRATPQWFASIKGIKKELLQAIEQVTWKPEWGKLRISNMVETREDWCISRQRAWGVPIPVFYAENGDAIMDEVVVSHVAELFKTHGSNIWYEKEAKDLLPKGYTHQSSPNGHFTKETDIMDVWFDSGTSYEVLKTRGLPQANLYLEGSDQYRGWFNSSISTSVAAYGKSPYQRVVSHGFVLDQQGRKMSKSLGNTIDPISVMKDMGADILRLWVSTTDYTSDVRIGPDTLKQISEGYRKIRNTLRYMIGNLYDFDPNTHYVSYSMRGKMNRAMTIKNQDTMNIIIDAYDTYQFDLVYRTVMPYIINEISAFYLDYTKDILYILAPNHFERRAIQSTIYDILMSLLKVLTPIMPHTMSEAYDELSFKKELDIYLERMPEKRVIEEPFNLRHAMSKLLELRNHTNQVLEQARTDKTISKSMQAHLQMTLDQATYEAVLALEIDLAQVLMVSKVDLKIGNDIHITLHVASGHTCDRCWNVVDEINDHHICPRCSEAVKEIL